MAIYVDKTDGSDDLDEGYGVDSHAFATVQFAIDCIPPIFTDDIDIYINNESYAEDVIINSKMPAGDFYITIHGTLVEESSGTATAKTQGNGAAQGDLTHAGQFGGYDNYLVYIDNDDEYRIIDSDDGNTITIVGCFSDAVDLDYHIYSWGTDIQTIQTINQKNLRIVDIEYTTTTTTVNINTFSDVTTYRCKINGRYTVFALARGNLHQCYIGNASAYATRFTGPTNLYGCKIEATGSNKILAYLEANAAVWFTDGTVIDGDDKTNDGIYGAKDATGSCYSSAANGYIRIQNCDNGIYAQMHCGITGTANVQYNNNNTNENAIAATFGAID
jgi:hypothetical protein